MECDYHVHTSFSDDSMTLMKSQVERACELGLDEICFTDHVDYGIKQDWDYPGEMRYRKNEPLANVNYPEYFREIEINRKNFHGRVNIKAGLEFGVQVHTIEQYERLYERYRDKLDFVLLSIHQVNNKEFWTQDFQQGKSQAEYNFEYYSEMLSVVKNFHNYSVLAHLDLLSRYDLNGVYPFENVRDIVAEILTFAINDGKGIELNTSSWRYRLLDTEPCRKILRLYKDLGGEIITLGSDAHTSDYIADHVTDARSILKDEIGFERFCTFEKMMPIFHEL